MSDKKEKIRLLTPPTSKLRQSEQQTAPKATIGQVVLDKFGNFRLASNDMTLEKANSERQSNSRSKSRRKYGSESRSRSQSSKRRFRSRSYDRRRSNSRIYRSRSGSRRFSYSRSRSRSLSNDRRRIRYRGRGSYDRATYYKPRFGSARYTGRGNRGGCRDFRGRGRDNWYRGNRHNRGGSSGVYRQRRDISLDRRVKLRSKSNSYHSDDQKRSTKFSKKSQYHHSNIAEKNWNEKSVESTSKPDILNDKIEL